MPSFKHILIGIGKICDADFRVEFTKDTVIVYNPQQHPILSGWRETTGAKLWRISLNPDQAHLPASRQQQQRLPFKPSVRMTSRVWKL